MFQCSVISSLVFDTASLRVGPSAITWCHNCTSTLVPKGKFL